ncbi:unnamed protein product, partial [Rotaria sp. Silwood1]
MCRLTKETTESEREDEDIQPQRQAITNSQAQAICETKSYSTKAEINTKPAPLSSYKCAVYPDLYVQPWHPTGQASPPIRSCLGTSGNFELVKNKYVRFTIHMSAAVIDELKITLFDKTSNTAICTVSAIGQDAGWMDCEQNVKTATHETLIVYYAKANFTTIVTRD